MKLNITIDTDTQSYTVNDHVGTYQTEGDYVNSHTELVEEYIAHFIENHLDIVLKSRYDVDDAMYTAFHSFLKAYVKDPVYEEYELPEAQKEVAQVLEALKSIQSFRWNAEDNQYDAYLTEGARKFIEGTGYTMNFTEAESPEEYEYRMYMDKSYKDQEKKKEFVRKFIGSKLDQLWI